MNFSCWPKKYGCIYSLRKKKLWAALCYIIEMCYFICQSLKVLEKVLPNLLPNRRQSKKFRSCLQHLPKMFVQFTWARSNFRKKMRMHLSHHKYSYINLIQTLWSSIPINENKNCKHTYNCSVQNNSAAIIWRGPFHTTSSLTVRYVSMIFGDPTSQQYFCSYAGSILYYNG